MIDRKELIKDFLKIIKNTLNEIDTYEEILALLLILEESLDKLKSNTTIQSIDNVYNKLNENAKKVVLNSSFKSNVICSEDMTKEDLEKLKSILDKYTNKENDIKDMKENKNLKN